MKGDLTLKILNFLEEAAASTGQILGLFFTDYHTSYRKARGLSKPKKHTKFVKKDFQEQERNRLNSLIYWLKEDGLITKSRSGLWNITKKGVKRKLNILNKKNNSPVLSFPKVIKSSEWKIIVFDIPESERRKRNQLRAMLKQLGFNMLQKSVWMGKIKLPESFIYKLNKMRIISHVEILTVTKSGSLKRLK